MDVHLILCVTMINNGIFNVQLIMQEDIRTNFHPMIKAISLSRGSEATAETNSFAQMNKFHIMR